MRYGGSIGTIQCRFRWKGSVIPHYRWNVANGFSSCVRRSIEPSSRETNKDSSVGLLHAFKPGTDDTTSTSGIDSATSPHPPKRGRPRTKTITESLDIESSEEINTTEPRADEDSPNTIPGRTALAKNPIVRQLQGKRRGRGSRTDRIQTVSPDLCDDILQRLAPSLSNLIGCNIVDLYPGAGLWSSKLHDVLKPKRHILVEPMMDVFSSFLQPLLDAPDSKYRLAEYKDVADQWDENRYIADGLLPALEGSEDRTRDQEGQNTSLLIVANMDSHQRSPASRAIYKTSNCHYRIVDYFQSVQNRSHFNRNGLVRMLMWMPDHEKTTVLPRTIMFRRKVAVLGELTCHIEEVAGGAHGQAVRRRATKIDFESGMQTAKRMEKANIQIPSTRLTELARQIQQARVNASDAGSDVSEPPLDLAVHNERDWYKELRALEKKFADGVYSRKVGDPPGVGKPYTYERHGINAPFTPEYIRLKYLRSVERDVRRRRSVLEELVQEQEDLEALDLTIREDDTLDDQTRKSKCEELEERQKQFQHRLDRLPVRHDVTFHTIADDKRAISVSPPILQWDRRSAEPIIATPQEFHPTKTLALLDFQPRTPSVGPLTKNQTRYLNVMLVKFFINPSQSVRAALNSLAVGAADALIPQAPSLHDPRKGGRHDVDQLHVCVLTTEMLSELAMAWDKWPFRPSMADFMKNQDLGDFTDEDTVAGMSRIRG